jgi:hypothetical protein
MLLTSFVTATFSSIYIVKSSVSLGYAHCRNSTAYLHKNKFEFYFIVIFYIFVTIQVSGTAAFYGFLSRDIRTSLFQIDL